MTPIDALGTLVITLNILSMAMINPVRLRLTSGLANLLLVVYGFLIGANPLMIGGLIIVMIHAFILLRMRKIRI
jgi:hypothetical protein